MGSQSVATTTSSVRYSSLDVSPPGPCTERHPSQLSHLPFSSKAHPAKPNTCKVDMNCSIIIPQRPASATESTSVVPNISSVTAAKQVDAAIQRTEGSKRIKPSVSPLSMSLTACAGRGVGISGSIDSHVSTSFCPRNITETSPSSGALASALQHTMSFKDERGRGPTTACLRGDSATSFRFGGTTLTVAVSPRQPLKFEQPRPLSQPPATQQVPASQTGESSRICQGGSPFSALVGNDPFSGNQASGPTRACTAQIPSCPASASTTDWPPITGGDSGGLCSSQERWHKKARRGLLWDGIATRAASPRATTFTGDQTSHEVASEEQPLQLSWSTPGGTPEQHSITEFQTVARGLAWVERDNMGPAESRLGLELPFEEEGSDVAVGGQSSRGDHNAKHRMPSPCGSSHLQRKEQRSETGLMHEPRAEAPGEWPQTLQHLPASSPGLLAASPTLPYGNASLPNALIGLPSTKPGMPAPSADLTSNIRSSPAASPDLPCGTLLTFFTDVNTAGDGRDVDPCVLSDEEEDEDRGEGAEKTPSQCSSSELRHPGVGSADAPRPVEGAAARGRRSAVIRATGGDSKEAREPSSHASRVPPRGGGPHVHAAIDPCPSSPTPVPPAPDIIGTGSLEWRPELGMHLATWLHPDDLPDLEADTALLSLDRHPFAHMGLWDSLLSGSQDSGCGTMVARGDGTPSCVTCAGQCHCKASLCSQKAPAEGGSGEVPEPVAALSSPDISGGTRMRIPSTRMAECCTGTPEKAEAAEGEVEFEQQTPGDKEEAAGMSVAKTDSMAGACDTRPQARGSQNHSYALRTEKEQAEEGCGADGPVDAKRAKSVGKGGAEREVQPRTCGSGGDPLGPGWGMREHMDLRCLAHAGEAARDSFARETAGAGPAVGHVGPPARSWSTFAGEGTVLEKQKDSTAASNPLNSAMDLEAGKIGERTQNGHVLVERELAGNTCGRAEVHRSSGASILESLGHDAEGVSGHVQPNSVADQLQPYDAVGVLPVLPEDKAVHRDVENVPARSETQDVAENSGLDNVAGPCAATQDLLMKLEALCSNRMSVRRQVEEMRSALAVFRPRVSWLLEEEPATNDLNVPVHAPHSWEENQSLANHEQQGPRLQDSNEPVTDLVSHRTEISEGAPQSGVLPDMPCLQNPQAISETDIVSTPGGDFDVGASPDSGSEVIASSEGARGVKNCPRGGPGVVARPGGEATAIDCPQRGPGIGVVASPWSGRGGLQAEPSGADGQGIIPEHAHESTGQDNTLSCAGADANHAHAQSEPSSSKSGEGCLPSAKGALEDEAQIMQRERCAQSWGFEEAATAWGQGMAQLDQEWEGNVWEEGNGSPRDIPNNGSPTKGLPSVCSGAATRHSYGLSDKETGSVDTNELMNIPTAETRSLEATCPVEAARPQSPNEAVDTLLCAASPSHELSQERSLRSKAKLRHTAVSPGGTSAKSPCGDVLAMVDITNTGNFSPSPVLQQNPAIGSPAHRPGLQMQIFPGGKRATKVVSPQERVPCSDLPPSPGSNPSHEVPLVKMPLLPPHHCDVLEPTAPVSLGYPRPSGAPLCEPEANADGISAISDSAARGAASRAAQAELPNPLMTCQEGLLEVLQYSEQRLPLTPPLKQPSGGRGGVHVTDSAHSSLRLCLSRPTDFSEDMPCQGPAATDTPAGSKANESCDQDSMAMESASPETLTVDNPAPLFGATETCALVDAVTERPSAGLNIRIPVRTGAWGSETPDNLRNGSEGEVRHPFAATPKPDALRSMERKDSDGLSRSPLPASCEALQHAPARDPDGPVGGPMSAGQASYRGPVLTWNLRGHDPAPTGEGPKPGPWETPVFPTELQVPLARGIIGPEARPCAPWGSTCRTNAQPLSKPSSRSHRQGVLGSSKGDHPLSHANFRTAVVSRLTLPVMHECHCSFCLS